MRVCSLLPCSHLKGKGSPLGYCLWCLLWFYYYPIWYPGTGVVLNCIDFWSLLSFLFCLYWVEFKLFGLLLIFQLSRDMRFPTMWYVPQISLRIRVFASRLNILRVLSYFWTSFGVSQLKKRLHRLIWVYTCQNATLLEITCRGSFTFCIVLQNNQRLYLSLPSLNPYDFTW